MSNDNPYIQTYQGTVDLLDPDPDDLILGVLAFSLAHMNRYTGHLGTYSVAEHLVLGTWVLADQGHKRGILAGYLMHDAHEAITGDISSPMKKAMLALGFDFHTLEDRHQLAVERRFRVYTRAPAVKAMDAAMCVTEATQGFGALLTRGGANGWPSVPPAPVQIRRWSPTRACAEFLEECNRQDVR